MSDRPDAAAIFDLLALIANPRDFKVRLREFGQAIDAAEAAQMKLIADRAAFAEHETQARAALAKERAEIDERHDAVRVAEGLLAERQEQVAEQERAWRNLGEPEMVTRGLQNPSAPAIAKARASYRSGNRDGTGRVPFIKQDADRRDVGGEPFPAHTTLTRDVSGDRDHA
jgi:hypothetical protein